LHDCGRKAASRFSFGLVRHRCRHPGQGRAAAAEPGPIDASIVERGPVLIPAHGKAAARTRHPAAPLNGSRLSLRSAGMTAAAMD